MHYIHEFTLLTKPNILCIEHCSPSFSHMECWEQHSLKFKNLPALVLINEENLHISQPQRLFFFMDHKTDPKILLHAFFKQVGSSLLLHRVCIFLSTIPAKWLVPGCGILMRLVCSCTLTSHLLQARAQATSLPSQAQLPCRVLKISVRGTNMKNLS